MRLAIRICACLEQRVDDFGVTFCSGPHQRRLLLKRIRRIHIDATIEQQAHSRKTAGTRGGHQRCLAFRMRALRIGAGLEEEFHHPASPVRLASSKGVTP